MSTGNRGQYHRDFALNVLDAVAAEYDALIAAAVVNEGQRWQEQVTRLRNALREAGAEMDRRYEMGAKAEREAIRQLAIDTAATYAHKCPPGDCDDDCGAILPFADLLNAARPAGLAGLDNDAADRMTAEGITGLYWDNLGHGGEV